MANTDTIKIITPYTDIPYAELPASEDANQDFTRVRSLQAGFGSKVFRLDKEGLWLGAETFATAPFSVDMLGNVTASSITLTGYVPTGGAAADVNAGATTITGTQITTGSITASKMNVSSLSSISANIGTVTAGTISAVTISGSTITGSTLTTASSGQRVVLTSTLAQFYNSSGTKIVETYAGSNSYLIEGQSASSSIVLDFGTSGAVAFRENGTTIAALDGSGLYPWTSDAYDLGNILTKWRDLWINGDFEYRTITQPVLYHGEVNGTSIFDDNTTFSVTNNSTGIYVVTHNFGTSNYQVQVTPFASTVKNITISSRGSNSFTVRIANLSDVLEDNDFFFLVTLLA